MICKCALWLPSNGMRVRFLPGERHSNDASRLVLRQANARSVDSGLDSLNASRENPLPSIRREVAWDRQCASTLADVVRRVGFFRKSFWAIR